MRSATVRLRVVQQSTRPNARFRLRGDRRLIVALLLTTSIGCSQRHTTRESLIRTPFIESDKVHSLSQAIAIADSKVREEIKSLEMDADQKYTVTNLGAYEARMTNRADDIRVQVDYTYVSVP